MNSQSSQHDSNTELVVIQHDIPLADSRIVADQLGVEHGPFMTNIILKYQDEVEQDFGQLHFQNGVVNGHNGGGNPERYALLTEEQTNVYMSYARNTEQARSCKRKLVKAFSDAKKIIAQLLAGKSLSYSDHINEVHRSIRDYNMPLAEILRFTVEERANGIAISGILREMGFAYNAFLDTSLAMAFKPYCAEKGYDMSLVSKTERARLVCYELNEDRVTYNFNKPIKRRVDSYPEDPFGLAWTKFLVEYYWPVKFLPYIMGKYKGEERAQNREAGIKVISMRTGLPVHQITERKSA